jgi:CRISPR-associated protein Csm4
MDTYKLILRQRSPTLTRWQADTLFGHLCWTLRYRDGAKVLREFLARYEAGEPPLLLSNGFPGDLLPRPIQPAHGLLATSDRLTRLEQAAAVRRARDVAYVAPEEFECARRGERVVPRRREVERTRTVFKNQISRLTGTTGGEGQLYSVDEQAFGNWRAKTLLPVTIYVRTATEQWASEIEALFQLMAHGGYGAKKSVGYGHFEVAGIEPFAFESIDDANGFITLSNFVPATDDPLDGYYERLVKYGKLGEEYTLLPNPFKKPLLMFTAGSSFMVRKPKPFYGRLIRGLPNIEIAEDVVQYGLAFDVPVQIKNRQLSLHPEGQRRAPLASLQRQHPARRVRLHL